MYPITHTKLYSKSQTDPITHTKLYSNKSKRHNNSYNTVQKHDKQTQYLIRHYKATSQTDPITQTTLYKNMTNGPNTSYDTIQLQVK